MTNKAKNATLIVFTLLAIGMSGECKTFYVAKNGNDGNSGSFEKPFLTIRKAAESMSAGDVCLVRQGIYRETVRPAQSGTANKLIVFRTYGKEKVIITGTEPVTNWTRHKGIIYKTKVDWDIDQLFENSRMMNEARWPNTGPNLLYPRLGVARKGTGSDRIVDPALSRAGIDWTGDKINLIPGWRWVAWTRIIKSCDPNKGEIILDPIDNSEPHAIRERTTYYIYGTLKALDSPGEWFFDKGTKTLYFYPSTGRNPNALKIEAKKRQFAFDLSKLSYIQVKGFCVFGSSMNLSDSRNCLIEDCHFKYIDHFTQCDGWNTKMDDSGLVVSGKNNEIRKCSIAYSAGNGISLLGEKNKVVNCIIHDVNYAAVDCSCIRAIGNGHFISRNTLFNAGRSCLVHRYLTASRIEYNHIYNPGLLTTDLGGTYCFQTDGKGTVICYNWVHDNKTSHGIGIYIDNWSPNHIVHHNVCWGNQDCGIRINTPSENGQFYNNTLIHNGHSFGRWGPDQNYNQKGTKIINNIATDELIPGDEATVYNNFIEKDPQLEDPKNRNFMPKNGSPCIDAGVEIKGITDGFKGKAPDIGAYEYGGKYWIPGHDWGSPPEIKI